MVSCKHEDDLAYIRMEDGKANAMNMAFLEKLGEAFENAKSAKAVVLSSGQGAFFSGGLDLKTLPGLSQPDFLATVNRFEQVMRSILEFPLPVVAHVQGHALAGGAVLLLCCDYAVGAMGEYKVGLNETAIGIPLPEFVLELGKLKLLPNHWMRALVHGEAYYPLDAGEAGYLDEVLNPDEAFSRAREKARQLAKVPADAYLTTKRLLRKPVLDVVAFQVSETIARIFLEGGLRHSLR